MDQAEPDHGETRPTPPVPEHPERHALAFHATRGGFARLLLVNSFLTLVTLGIYRFWAKTRVRRFLWRNVSFLDDPLEYTGTGGELFVGFLIVIAILFPLGLIYSAIQTMVPPDTLYLSIGLEAGYYLVLFALLQIGFYRMWRYRMSRTRWRGVRFGLDGSTWTYLKLSAGWTLLTALTLGIAYPWMQVDLWRYQVRHTRLGDQSFRFEGAAKPLIVPWLVVLIPGVVYVGGMAFIGYLGTNAEQGAIADVLRSHPVLLSTGAAALISSVFIMPVSYFYFRIRCTRYFISGLVLGDARFHSALPFWRLFWYAVLSLVLIVACAGVGFGWFGAGFLDLAVNIQDQEVDPELFTSLFEFWIVVLVISIVIGPFIWALLFKFELIKRLTVSTAIENPHVLEHAAQSESTGPGTGEGLADALDIGGF